MEIEADDGGTLLEGGDTHTLTHKHSLTLSLSAAKTMVTTPPQAAYVSQFFGPFFNTVVTFSFYI